MKYILSIVLLIAFYFLLTASALADVVCQPIYGGGQTCVQVGNIVINKQVQHPKTNDFVDNLSVNDPKFAPEQLVNFKITVVNTGSTMISSVNIQDLFPQFVNFAAGAGSFDSNAKKFSFSIQNLNPGEQRTFVISGKIVANDQLPSDKAIVCVVNQVTASSDSQRSQDNAEFCIQRDLVAAPTTKGGLKVFPQPTVATTPSTGPELLPLLALLPSGALGFFLRKKTEK